MKKPKVKKVTVEVEFGGLRFKRPWGGYSAGEPAQVLEPEQAPERGRLDPLRVKKLMDDGLLEVAVAAEHQKEGN